MGLGQFIFGFSCGALIMLFYANLPDNESGSISIDERVYKSYLPSEDEPWKQPIISKREKPMVFASLSSTNHTQYLLSLPLAALSWINIGAQPIVCLAGRAEDYSSKEIQPVFKLFEKFNIGYRFLNPTKIPAHIISQTCRMFPATSGEFLPDDIFITGDADFVPFHLYQHWQARADLFLYNSACCGNLNVKNRVFPMYPMCTIGARRDEWRRIFGTMGNAYENATILESILIDFFGIGFFEESTAKGSANWYTDQKILSYWIDIWKEKYNGTIVEQKNVVGRMDRIAWPSEIRINRENLTNWMDAHLPFGVAKSWPLTRPLFLKLLSPHLFVALQEYVASLRI